jgi:hypothetical protein
VRDEFSYKDWGQTVEKPLQKHIVYLQNCIHALTKRAAEPNCTSEERNRFQAEILIAEQALASYRTAYELEQEIAGELCGAAAKDTRTSRTNVRS